jgi:hypothetical protein
MMMDGKKSKIAALKGYIPQQIKNWYKMGILFIILILSIDATLIYTNNATNIQNIFALDIMTIISVIICSQLIQLINRC